MTNRDELISRERLEKWIDDNWEITEDGQGRAVIDYKKIMAAIQSGALSPPADALGGLMPKACIWSQDGDDESDTYQTSCGNMFVIIDGTPEYNNMKHCCYCGGILEQSLYTDDEEPPPEAQSDG